MRECLRAQRRHPPFPPFLPSSTNLHPSLRPEKKTRRRILEHRGVVYNESGVNLILTPLYHQDVSHGRGHSRGASVYNPFVVTVANFREDGPSSRSLIAYYFLSSFVSFVSSRYLISGTPFTRDEKEREREIYPTRTWPAGKVSRVFDPVRTVCIRDIDIVQNYFQRYYYWIVLSLP